MTKFPHNLVLILYFFIPRVLCLFEMCNHKIDLQAFEKLFLNSPYYPAEYPIGSSCRYVIKAPANYKLKFTCNIKLSTPHAAVKCVNEAFYFNREGSEILTESEYFCGTGQMERKSFLNQAALSYISTPNYKRILSSSLKDAKEGVHINKTKKTETKMQAEQQQKITTTTKGPTAVTAALKVNQLTTTKTPIAMFYNTLATSFAKSFSITSSSVETNMAEVKNSNSTSNVKEKKVSNTLAYTVAAFDIKTTEPPTKSPKRTATKSLQLRTTSVLDYNDSLPANTWHSGSMATNKISTKRAAAVSAQPATSSTLKPINHLMQQTRSVEDGGGSFSCLIEVIDAPCECGWSSQVKIAGAAAVAGVNEFPAMAGLMTIKNQMIFCGATIIHQRYLLSAAHCFATPETSTPQYLTAVVGEHDLSTVLDSLYTRQYELMEIIRHEHFQVSASEAQNDIAILKTRLPIEWNRGVGPACLPFYALQYGSGSAPYASQRVEAAGWGTTSFGGQQSSLLLKTTLDVVPQAACRNILKNLPFGVFCTYTPGLDTCQYDSGGALYVRAERLYAVGIVSYGYACAAKSPSVNTRVSGYLSWIREKTPEVKYCIR